MSNKELLLRANVLRGNKGDIMYCSSTSEDKRIENQFISKDELKQLSSDELIILDRNLKYGERLNNQFKRSQYYPLPRNLCFPHEKTLIERCASNRINIVEIGVFEGASSLLIRRSMSSQGTLHLIDPFVTVPDSKLTARPVMAKFSLLCCRNGKIKWYKDYSYNVARCWKENVDFLFIDGDHSEIACRRDWDDWRSFVTIGGVVAFHDSRFGLGDGSFWDGWPGPSRVVNELFREHGKLPNWRIVDEVESLVVAQRLY